MKLITSKQFAMILGYQPNTIAKWRTKGKGPAYIRPGKVGGRVHYDIDVVKKFLEERSFKHTSEEALRALADCQK
jgi:phage terminase Nu1 subunit (DNA packaging protein)